jgi:hypothetical protein
VCCSRTIMWIPSNIVESAGGMNLKAVARWTRRLTSSMIPPLFGLAAENQAIVRVPDPMNQSETKSFDPDQRLVLRELRATT